MMAVMSFEAAPAVPLYGRSVAQADRQAPEPSRFERKRELILDAATELINERGVKGMTSRSS